MSGHQSGLTALFCTQPESTPIGLTDAIIMHPLHRARHIGIGKHVDCTILSGEWPRIVTT